MPPIARRLIIAAFLFAALLGSLYYYGRRAQTWVEEQLRAVDPSSQQAQLVTIASGSSTAEVAQVLKGRGLIKDERVFRYYSRFLKLDSKLQGGEYELSPGMTPAQILKRLSTGQVVVYRFTVPEGLTVAEMADLLDKKRLAERERFLKLARESLAAAELTGGQKGLEEPLEGYLFPSTYNYRPGVTEEQILEMMIGGFRQTFTEEWKRRAAELKLSLHEVVTLASIIEEEAQVAKERGRISGVYHNRMRVGMKLDADPTVRYALKKPPTEELLYKDLEIDSPYNTYRVAGLPPGPIAAPGAASIRAALYPETHDFWYFVARADGTGEHYFGQTLAEQEENIAKAEANAKQKK